MRVTLKRLLLCLAAAAVLIPNINIAVDVAANDAANATASDAANEPDEEKAPYTLRTEDETLALMKTAAENDRMIFCYLEDEDLFALKDKASGSVWWSSPINAAGDEKASAAQINELKSAVVITYGDPQARSSSTKRSGETNKAGKRINPSTYKETQDGLKVVYNFKKPKIKIPVVYKLTDNYLEVTVNTSEITEEDSLLLTSVTIFPAFGAGSKDETGCFVLPDGCGATIEFNNGKTNAAPYSQRLYGADITAVSETKPAVTESLSLPVYGIVRESGALSVVASRGDTNAVLNASVGMATKSSTYNLCSYSFITRDSDTYYMSGINPLTVFESGEIKTPTLALRYYPTADETDDGSIDYVDVAAKYREHLTTESGVTKKTKENSSPFYLDLYGGAMKTKSVLGIPVSSKHCFTSYEQALEIISALSEKNVGDMVIGYNNWTDAGIKNQVDYKAKPSAALGGKKAFNKLLSYIDDKKLKLYPVADNTVFESSLGYGAFSDTAIRINGQYSRRYTYSAAFGVKDESEDTYSLLSPSVLPEILSQMAESYADYGRISGLSIGALNNTLFGDYGKKAVSRSMAADYITDGLKKINENVGQVLSDCPNAYILPYTDNIVNIPLSSSKFDIFNDDIPFVQCVLHGLIPYSSTAINGDADSERTLLLAIASGTNLHYDMMYAEASELKDTEFDIYFYAHYEYLIDDAASEYSFASQLLSPVSDSFIVSCNENDGVITTTYSNGSVTVVDTKTGVCSIDGKELSLSDYIAEGELIF